MNLTYIYSWDFFLVCFAVALATTAVMSRQATYFFTMGTARKSFSIFDLEFPSSPTSAFNLLSGIDKLGSEASKVKAALRGQLFVDFLFMPGIYLAIFVLCGKSAELIGGWGGSIFTVISLLQLLAWGCDITENAILLRQVSHPVQFKVGQFKAYQVMEAVKWGSSLGGFFAAMGALSYCWLIGNYRQNNLHYFGVLGIEIVLFLLFSKLLTRKSVKKS